MFLVSTFSHSSVSCCVFEMVVSDLIISKPLVYPSRARSQSTLPDGIPCTFSHHDEFYVRVSSTAHLGGFLESNSLNLLSYWT